MGIRVDFVRRLLPSLFSCALATLRKHVGPHHFLVLPHLQLEYN